MKKDFFLSQIPKSENESLLFTFVENKLKKTSLTVKKNYILSRLALKFCLELEFGKNVDFSDLELINFQELPVFPDLLISLSHTKGLSGSLIGDKSLFLGIGLDIEPLARDVKENARKFFENEFDSHFSSDLYLWCGKEAAYKAVWGDLSRKNGAYESLTLKSIWIKNNFFGIVQNLSKAIGFLEYKTIKVDKITFIVAQAFILK